jgi:predicted metal-dependent HD superfamily phosphohydrolase
LGDELVLNMLAREIGSGHSIEYAGMRERRWGIGRGELILHLLETPFIYAGGKGIGA